MDQVKAQGEASRRGLPPVHRNGRRDQEEIKIPSAPVSTDNVRITPGVSMLAVLSNLNYKPWFALAEYVDNAVQSMIENRALLCAVDGPGYRLRVDIDYDSQSSRELTIKDNAAGIPRSEFARAFRPASPPPIRSGLSEFGMGLKSASCWFAPVWSVRTTSIDDDQSYDVAFDIETIVENDIEELTVSSSPAPVTAHGTLVTLLSLHNPPVGRTIGKIKQHLTDIYRVLVRRGDLDLRFNNEPLIYNAPAVLVAPFFKTPAEQPVEWRKTIDLDLGNGKKVTGFAELRDPGSTKNPGFALFRRSRVIEGSGDDGYKPTAIFGGGNSYASQRLIGELHLEGFDVSHTKDGFQWGDVEPTFLDALRSQLDSEPLPLLRQAEGFRKNETSRAQALAAEKALNSTTTALAAKMPELVPSLETGGTPAEAQPPAPLADAVTKLSRTVDFEHEGREWNIQVEMVNETLVTHWYTRTYNTDDPNRVKMHVRLNTAHPFLVRFAQRDGESLEAILRLALAVCVGEIFARLTGSPYPSVVTRNIDLVLTNALSQA